MKRILILFFISIMVLSGCVPNDSTNDKIKIVCTSFPYYDFTRNIAGDKAEVNLLVPIGTEIHTFDPTPKDIITVGDADLFIANGGESEAWVEELLEGVDNKPEEIMYMTDMVPLLKNGEHTDEHIWTSPKNAMILTEAIYEKLCQLDMDNAEYYNKNFTVYSEKIAELDNAFAEAVSSSTGNTVVFGDRFPFLYLTSEYGLNYKAAFSGCGELTEPTAKTVTELIKTVDAEAIPVIFYVEFSNRKICDAICEETGAKPMLMHSVHNITKSEFDLKADYISLMTENAKALKEAIG